MASKSFKGYGALWSVPDNSGVEANKQAHDKDNKQAPKNMTVEPEPLETQDNNKHAPENSIKEAPVKKKGRPKLDTTQKKAHFNLLLRPATITALTAIAGRLHVESGRRVTVTGLITKLIDEFIESERQDGD